MKFLIAFLKSPVFVGPFIAGVIVAICNAVIDSRPNPGVDEVLNCVTEKNKKLEVARIVSNDSFLIRYDNHPRLIKANDMGTSYRYSNAEPVANREIYFKDMDGVMVTIGVSDKGGKDVTAYIHRDGSYMWPAVSDTCVQENIKDNLFGNPKLFSNMTEVDDQ